MGTIWTLQDAKNKFSALVEAAERGHPQRVSKRGVEAMVISVAEFERLTALASRPTRTLIAHILSAPKPPEGLEDIFDDRHDFSSEYREIELE